MDPAPIPREALEMCIQPFGSAIGLPASAYTDPAVFAWEREAFFDASWVCLGRRAPRLHHADQRELHGWVFARRDPAGLTFEEQIGNLGEHLAPYEPERLVVGARTSYEIRANWKLLHENFQECYHCSEIHPALCRVTPPDSGWSIDIRGSYVAGPMELMDGAETMSLDGRSGGMMIPGLPSEIRRQVGYFGVFPNLLISTMPDYVLTHRIEPLAPDRTFIECEWLFPPEAIERTGFDPSYAVEFWDVTNREDWAACESLQRSAGGRGYRPGPLSWGWEAGVYAWIAMIARGYLSGRIGDRPSLPDVAALPRYEALRAARVGRP
jgi:Rieske 2Fe-2S family protein